MHEAVQCGAEGNIGTTGAENCLPQGLDRACLSTRVFVLPEPFPFFKTNMREREPFNIHTLQGLLCDTEGSR